MFSLLRNKTNEEQLIIEEVNEWIFERINENKIPWIINKAITINALTLKEINIWVQTSSIVTNPVYIFRQRFVFETIVQRKKYVNHLDLDILFHLHCEYRFLIPDEYEILFNNYQNKETIIIEEHRELNDEHSNILIDVLREINYLKFFMEEREYQETLKNIHFSCIKNFIKLSLKKEFKYLTFQELEGYHELIVLAEKKIPIRLYVVEFLQELRFLNKDYNAVIRMTT